VSEQVNRKCPSRNKRNTISQHSPPYLALSPQTPHPQNLDILLYYALLCWSCDYFVYVDAIIVRWWELLLLRWYLVFSRIFLSNSWASCYRIHRLMNWEELLIMNGRLKWCGHVEDKEDAYSVERCTNIVKHGGGSSWNQTDRILIQAILSPVARWCSG